MQTATFLATCVLFVFFLSNLKLNPFFTFLMQKLAGKTVKLKKYSSAIEAWFRNYSQNLQKHAVTVCHMDSTRKFWGRRGW